MRSTQPSRRISRPVNRIDLRGAALAVVLGAVGVMVQQLPLARAATIDSNNLHANAAFSHFLSTYWNSATRQFYARSDQQIGPGGNVTASTWWAAELWEALMDDLDRTGSSFDRSLVDQVYDGYVAHNGFGSDYNDDRGWWALAATRAYGMTLEPRYLTLAENIANDQWLHWDSTFGGGIWWRRSMHDQKNVATNAPAAITNARLYALTGLDKYRRRAVALFAWVDGHLRSSGQVADRIELPNNKVWTDYTYNYGTYIGAALALNKITGYSFYLSRATSLANSAMRRLTNSAGVLRDEGNGDGGGFKGVFVRNFTMIATWPALSNTTKAPYASFLANNGSVAWNHRITSRVWGSNWNKYGTLPIDSMTDSSAVDLFEAVARTH